MSFLKLIPIVALLVACNSGKFNSEISQIINPSQEQPIESLDIISSFKVPQEVLSLTIPISEFNIEKKAGKTYLYMLGENAIEPKIDDVRWQETIPTSYTFSIDGSKTLYAWVKDSEGTLYKNRSIRLNVSLPDMTSPVISSFTVPPDTSSADISINSFSVTDNVQVDSYLITETIEKPFANDIRWANTPPQMYRIQSYPMNGGGQQQQQQSQNNSGVLKTLYSWAKDSSGNISASRSTIIMLLPLQAPLVDMNPPSLYVFQIPTTNGGLSITVNSVLGWDDIGITGYLISETNSPPLVSDPKWTPTPPSTYLTSTSGYKTLYIWAKDASGKISTALSANTYVYLDTASDPLVVILVRDYLYDDSLINTAISQLVGSLSSRGYSNPEILSIGKMNPLGLRQLLITKRGSTQRKFAGVFLIGDINQPTYVNPNDFNGATAVFPSDVTLAALDSLVDFSSVDGRFSNLRGDVHPKIWISRIDFSRNSLYGNELDSTSYYLTKLAKDEAVKSVSALTGKALIFVEKDWVGSYLSPTMPGFVTFSKNYPNLIQTEYLNSIKQPYEMMHVMVHSDPNRHYFSQFSLSASPGFLVETRLINLFACSAVLPSAVSLLEPYMLSGTRGGIVVIGSTKSGSMADGQNQFYQKLKDGKSVGDAFVEWQGDFLYNDYTKKWHLGMTLNGDPTIKPSY